MFGEKPQLFADSVELSKWVEHEIIHVATGQRIPQEARGTRDLDGD